MTVNEYNTIFMKNDSFTFYINDNNTELSSNLPSLQNNYQQERLKRTWKWYGGIHDVILICSLIPDKLWNFLVNFVTLTRVVCWFKLF